jgi:uncharacterized membrane protein YgcG
MGDDDRVVLRSPWRAEVLNMAPIAVVFVVFAAWSGDIVSLVTVAVVLALMTVLFHYLTKVVLTRHAIELWRIGRTVIPWPQVGVLAPSSGQAGGTSRRRGTWSSSGGCGRPDVAAERSLPRGGQAVRLRPPQHLLHPSRPGPQGDQ